ncbi:hypoxanthine phosphoribosyltransferase [Candidatus Sumerlaeota bacterium]|nr:hypoxanthine phosphoribosyltransferase [Candidatus Sumerlaeota bacterium]
MRSIAVFNAEKHEQFKDLHKVLLTEEEIVAKVMELGAKISADYAGKDLILVSVLKGGIVFLADLLRSITIPVRFDVVGASSYGASLTASSCVKITKELDLDIRNKHVLIVEDVLDTGRTLQVLMDLLKMLEPASLDICCLFDKPIGRRVKIDCKYVGFELPDEFVVGYGLDAKEQYRGLPCLGVPKREAIEKL